MSQFKNIDVALDNVFLDNENPRHDPIDAEPEIIARLVAAEKVANLAASIAEHGTSPLERLAAIRHPTQNGKYTVVEGNRRLCALKLLKDPKRAPTATARRVFEGLKANGQAAPSRIELVLFPDRASASYWLSLRHEGEQDGVGTRNWKAAEKARFNAQGSPTANPNAQSLALLDYAEKRGLLTEDERKEVPLTTVTRYLSNPVLRSTLGLANNRDLSIDVDQSEFDSVAQVFLSDARAGEKVNSRTKSEERKKYAQSLQKRGLAPTSRLPSPIIAAPVQSKKSTATRSSRHPNKRPYIIPTGFKLRTRDTVLMRVFTELKTIDPELSFAGGYLLRAFVEKIAYEFARIKGRGTNGKKLHDVLIICCEELKKDGITDRQLKPLSVMTTNRDNSTSPDTLGAWVHGSLIPTATALKSKWDEMAPGLTLMIERLK